MRVMSGRYENEVINVLKEFEMPVDIENVRTRAGIKSWVTAKATLLDLAMQNRIKALKTSKSWIFWIDRDAKG